MRLLAFLLLLLVPATAAVAAGQPAAGASNSSARLLSCDAQARTATFQGDMQAFGGARRLSMRFTLQVRDLANPAWRRVAAPDLDEWLSAVKDRPRYVYDKSVANLPAGADYRSVVRFRWRTAKGKVAARAVHRTRACRQPDTRANLEPLKISVSEGSKDDTSFYTVRFANTGQTEAPPFATRLDVPGAEPVDQMTGEPLAPGEEDVLLFEAPRCEAGTMVTATVDPEAQVDESDELDNALAVSCPTA